jgi:3-deoxy-manno-octulosonate cytidylyltransferase (CMP-KDO synthetase)
VSVAKKQLINNVTINALLPGPFNTDRLRGAGLRSAPSPPAPPAQAAAMAHAVHLHLGVYAYRPAALRAYAAAAPAALENLEGLEQLRFCDIGLPVGIALCPAPGWDAIECNNPGDIALIERVLAQTGVD